MSFPIAAVLSLDYPSCVLSPLKRLLLYLVQIDPDYDKYMQCISEFPNARPAQRAGLPLMQGINVIFIA
jgi:hypothetical protein